MNSASLPGIVKREFGEISVVIRMRPASTEVNVGDKLQKGDGWEAYVKATDNLNEDAFTAVVIHGDWYIAIGLDAKEIFAQIPWYKPSPTE